MCVQACGSTDDVFVRTVIMKQKRRVKEQPGGGDNDRTDRTVKGAGKDEYSYT